MTENHPVFNAFNKYLELCGHLRAVIGDFCFLKFKKL